MGLRDKQSVFWVMVARTILFAESIDKPIFILEWTRSEAQQAANVAKGASKTMNSKHLSGLAVDFSFIADVNDDGKINYSADKYRQVGEFWEKLNPANRWGGRFGDDPKTDKIEGWDAGHLEYNV